MWVWSPGLPQEAIVGGCLGSLIAPDIQSQAGLMTEAEPRKPCCS